MSTPSIAMIPSGFKAGKVYSVLPLSGAADLTFTRASSATRVNKDGLIETVATGVPRLDYSDGVCPVLLIEPQQTQLYELTETMSTQTKTVTAVQHTVGFYGTGTLNFTGAFVGSLVGTGVNDRVELTFTPTAGSLISTVSGTVTKSQLVTGNYLGSYIPNVTTGQITRLADAASKTGVSSLINSSEGTFFVHSQSFSNNITTAIVSLSDGTSNNRIAIRYSNSLNGLSFNLDVAGTPSFSFFTSAFDTSLFIKMAISYKLNEFKVYINGVKVHEDLSGAVPAANTFNRIAFDNGASASVFISKVKDLRVYTTVLSESEATTLTTL